MVINDCREDPAKYLDGRYNVDDDGCQILTDTDTVRINCEWTNWHYRGWTYTMTEATKEMKAGAELLLK